MLNVKELEAFRAFIECGSVTSAAERLNRTQPQVGRLLVALEESVGFNLFKAHMFAKFMAGNAALQAAYVSLLNNLHTGYKKGRFLGANEINAARDAMVGTSGIVAKAEAVASQNFLVVFTTPADARFAPVDPPGLVVA